MSDPALQLICAALVLVVPVGVAQGLPRGPAQRILTSMIVGAVAAAASLLVDVLIASTLDLPASVLDASLASAVAIVVMLLAAPRVGSLAAAVFALAWSLLVFQVMAAAALDGVPSLVQLVFGAIDYGGVLASHVAAGGAIVAHSFLPASRGIEPPLGIRAASWSRSVFGSLLLVAGASAWLLGAERVLTAASGRTLANAVVGMILAAATWVIVEKIALDRVTPAGLIAGAGIGWAAIGAGVPYLSPVALTATAVVATAAAVGVAARWLREPSTAVRGGAVGAVIAAVVGGVVMTLLADGFGLAETGTLTLTIGQVGAAIAAFAIGVAGGALSWLLARGLTWWAIPDSN